MSVYDQPNVAADNFAMNTLGEVFKTATYGGQALDMAAAPSQTMDLEIPTQG